MAELDARELDHVDLDSFRGEVVEQRFQQHLRFVMQEKSPVKEIDPHDAQSLLLEIVFPIEYADMNNDLTVLVPRAGLVFDAHPSVGLVGALIIASRDGVGEGEEGGGVSARHSQPLQVESVLVVEHTLQAFARYVALAAAVDRVTHCHVVGGNGFGDGSSSRTNVEG